MTCRIFMKLWWVVKKIYTIRLVISLTRNGIQQRKPNLAWRKMEFSVTPAYAVKRHPAASATISKSAGCARQKYSWSRALRAWFCKPCKDALDRERTRTDGPQPMLNSCYCIGQLQNNWLCNADRVQAKKDIETKAREQNAAGVQDRTGLLCGHCRVNVANPTTAAWRCICCNQIVTLP